MLGRVCDGGCGRWHRNYQNSLDTVKIKGQILFVFGSKTRYWEWEGGSKGSKARTSQLYYNSSTQEVKARKTKSPQAAEATSVRNHS